MNPPQVEKSLTFLRPSYDELVRLMEEVYSKIEAAGYRPDYMLSIARGGWFFGRVLSDLFEADETDCEVISITAELYTGIGTTRRKVRLKQELNRSLIQQRVLVIDDVSDTGETLDFVVEYGKWLGAAEIKTATCYYKTGSKVIPDFFAKELPRSTWIVFPYEKHATSKELARKGVLLE